MRSDGCNIRVCGEEHLSAIGAGSKKLDTMFQALIDGTLPHWWRRVITDNRVGLGLRIQIGVLGALHPPYAA
jgi:hypothetical protein